MFTFHVSALLSRSNAKRIPVSSNSSNDSNPTVAMVTAQALSAGEKPTRATVVLCRVSRAHACVGVRVHGDTGGKSK